MRARGLKNITNVVKPQQVLFKYRAAPVDWRTGRRFGHKFQASALQAEKEVWTS
jgi:hypothetical protein